MWRFKFQHKVKASESRITYITRYIQQYLIRSGDTITIAAPVAAGDPYRISFAPEANTWQLDGEEKLEGHEEGSARTIRVNHYERDPRNRQAAIQAHGVRCFGCRLEMAEVYGQIAKGYIHVHHVKPLAANNPTRPSVDDLVPLCPNCHAVVHLEDPPISINRLKALIRQQRGTQ